MKVFLRFVVCQTAAGRRQVTESIARMQVLCNGLKQPFSSSTRLTAHSDTGSAAKDSARYDSINTLM